MNVFIMACVLWAIAGFAQAATLTWDAQTITSPLTVEHSATQCRH